MTSISANGTIAQLDVTIVLTCYNYAHYLPCQLDAIEALNPLPKRVVFVDDGSDDASIDIWMKRRRDLHLRGIFTSMVVMGSNCGLSAARNAGIEKADTEWILPLDPDDRIKKHALVELKVKHEHCDVLVFSYEAFGHNGRRMVNSVQEYEKHDDYLEAYRSGKRLATSCSPFRRWIWEANPYDESMRVCEDTAFWLAAAKMGARFEVTDRPAIEVRYHPDRLSFTISDQERQQVKQRLHNIAKP